MKKVTISLFLGIALTLIGCDRNPPKQLENAYVSELNAYLADQQLRYYCLSNKLNLHIDTSKTPPVYRCEDTLTQNQKDTSEETKKQIRNDFIDRVVLLIDANYGEFIAAFGEGRSTGNFVADLIELSTSAVIGVIDNVNTLQILGVSLTAFRGTRSAFDLNFYEKQTTPILINMMDSGRNKVYAIIIEKKKKDINNYSLTESMKDLVDYYNAGTIIRAFTTLSKDAAYSSIVTEGEVLRLRGITLSTVVTNPNDPVFVQTKQAYNIDLDLLEGIRSDDPERKKDATRKLKEIVATLETTNPDELKALSNGREHPTFAMSINT